MTNSRAGWWPSNRRHGLLPRRTRDPAAHSPGRGRRPQDQPMAPLGLPRFQRQVDRGHAMTTRLSIDELTTKTGRRFTAQQKAEAVALCLQEGLSCNAEAQRLGLPSSSLARWVRQARSIGTDRSRPERPERPGPAHHPQTVAQHLHSPAVRPWRWRSKARLRSASHWGRLRDTVSRAWKSE